MLKAQDEPLSHARQLESSLESDRRFAKTEPVKADQPYMNTAKTESVNAYHASSDIARTEMAKPPSKPQ